MKLRKTVMSYEAPADLDILHAYINKNAAYNRTNARKIKRELRKLRLA